MLAQRLGANGGVESYVTFLLLNDFKELPGTRFRSLRHACVGKRNDALACR